MCTLLSLVCRYLEAVKQLKTADMRFGIVVLSFPLVFFFLPSKKSSSSSVIKKKRLIDGF